MGRLWQTLILSEWRKELAWLPVETLVCENQELYYQALGEADKAGDCTCFIAFILQIIVNSLKESLADNYKMSEEVSEEMSVESKILSKTARQILAILKDNPTITILELAQQLQVTTRTIERNIKQLQNKQLLKRVGSTKAGYWQIVKD